jgi:hypothetical protein
MGAPIVCFIVGLIICGEFIFWLSFHVSDFVEKYRHQKQQDRLQEPTKSSRYHKLELLTKRNIHKLKMMMSGVSTEEHLPFNV